MLRAGLSWKETNRLKGYNAHNDKSEERIQTKTPSWITSLIGWSLRTKNSHVDQLEQVMRLKKQKLFSCYFMFGKGQNKGVKELRVRMKIRARSESCSERRINRKRTWEVLAERDGKRRKFEIQGWGGETSKPLRAFGENISQQWRKPPGILLCASHHTDSESSWRKQPPLPLGRQQLGLLGGNAAPAATIQFAMTPVIWA